MPENEGETSSSIVVPTSPASTEYTEAQDNEHVAASNAWTGIDLEQANNASDGEARYLDLIDSLRELGISSTISLPQLVVVGEQSSGKSALLEGLFNFPFPIASNVCTRFATEVNLRRSDQAGWQASLIPGLQSADEGNAFRNHLRQWNASASEALDGERFRNLMNEVTTYLGLPTSNSAGPDDATRANSQRFSEAILKLEIRHRNARDFSIIDLPGLFRNETVDQTRDDARMVKRLVSRYLEDPRTIIIERLVAASSFPVGSAVSSILETSAAARHNMKQSVYQRLTRERASGMMDATTNLAGQEIFSMARRYDPSGNRTVGVITKVDLVPRGDEPNIIRIFNNIEQPLRHGWFLVRNRSTEDIARGITIEERHARERSTLNQRPWSSVTGSRRGIHPLHAYLSRLLYEHIRRELPSLVGEMEHHQQDDLTRLQRLGPPRENISDQRAFLNSVATTYERNVEDAFSGVYDPDLYVPLSLRLNQVIHDLRTRFVSRMDVSGSLYRFETEQSTNIFSHLSPLRSLGQTQQSGTSGSSTTPQSGGGALATPSRAPINVPQSAGSTSSSSTPIVRDGIMAWIREVYRNTRGRELPGMINPKILESLFREQTRNWESISLQLLDSVTEALLRYNSDILPKIIEDLGVRTRLEAAMRDYSRASVEDGKQRLREDLAYERNTLQTMNDSFIAKLQQAREKRVRKRLEDQGYLHAIDKRIDMPTLLQAAHPGHMTEAVDDIHDILKAYYEVSKDRFKDNVWNQVVDRYLLGLNEPVRVFSSSNIGGFSGITDEEITSIAAEDPATSTARIELTNRINNLENALILARRV